MFELVYICQVIQFKEGDQFNKTIALVKEHRNLLTISAQNYLWIVLRRKLQLLNQNRLYITSIVQSMQLLIGKTVGMAGVCIY